MPAFQCLRFVPVSALVLSVLLTLLHPVARPQFQSQAQGATDRYPSHPNTPPKGRGAGARSLSDRDQRVLAARIAARYAITPGFAAWAVQAAAHAAQRERIDPVLLLAVIGTESSFDPDARSPRGAVGLTQTIPRWHRDRIAALAAQGRTLSEPGANIEVGASIMAGYLRSFHGDRVLALQQYGGSLGDGEHVYANRVLSVYRRLVTGLPSVLARREPRRRGEHEPA